MELEGAVLVFVATLLLATGIYMTVAAHAPTYNIRFVGRLLGWLVKLATLALIFGASAVTFSQSLKFFN